MTAPLMFFEKRGSYGRKWRCRWRRVRCALGLHVWWLGPYDIGGTVGGRPVPDDVIPEWCGGGSPWCKARRVVRREDWPTLGVRFSIWRRDRKDRKVRRS